jgi:transcriptional regulator with XRE-family HTH domain
MKRFGDTLRHLMELKGVTGVQLSAETGLTTTSISRLLNGQTRPRQVTLTRLMKYLCETKAEEQSLLRAYSGLETLPEESVLDDEKNAQEERSRALRYLEMKSQSIAFKRSVARELDKAGLSYKQDYAEGVFVSDFLIEQDSKRVALECKFNVHRDFEKTGTIAELLKENLKIDSVLIVVPYAMNSVTQESSGLTIVELSELAEFILSSQTVTQNNS